MSQNVIYVGVDVDDVRYHGSALDQYTGEALDFQCRPILMGLVGAARENPRCEAFRPSAAVSILGRHEHSRIRIRWQVEASWHYPAGQSSSAKPPVAGMVDRQAGHRLLHELGDGVVDFIDARMLERVEARVVAHLVERLLVEAQSMLPDLIGIIIEVVHDEHG